MVDWTGLEPAFPGLPQTSPCWYAMKESNLPVSLRRTDAKSIGSRSVGAPWVNQTPASSVRKTQTITILTGRIWQAISESNRA
jgi:hypothetical protein